MDDAAPWCLAWFARDGGRVEWWHDADVGVVRFRREVKTSYAVLTPWTHWDEPATPELLAGLRTAATVVASMPNANPTEAPIAGVAAQ